MKAMSGIKMKYVLDKMFEGYGKSVSKVNNLKPNTSWDSKFICSFKKSSNFIDWFKEAFGDKYIREDFLEAIWEHESDYCDSFTSHERIDSEVQFSLVLLIDFFREELKRLDKVDLKLQDSKVFANA